MALRIADAPTGRARRPGLRPLSSILAALIKRGLDERSVAIEAVAVFTSGEAGVGRSTIALAAVDHLVQPGLPAARGAHLEPGCVALRILTQLPEAQPGRVLDLVGMA